MTVNYDVTGTDLASLLAPIHAGWPQAAATLYLSAGADLNTIFAEAASGTAYGTTNYKHSGVDIGTLFAAIGTTAVALNVINPVTASLAAGNPSGTVTSSSGGTTGTGINNISASKGKQSGYTYTWTIASGSGVTFPGQGTSSSTVTATVNAGTTNSGTFYVAVSDGTTTTNTNTVSWSLQNTSVALPGTLVLSIGAGAITDMQVISGTTLYVVPSSTHVYYTTTGTSWSNFVATQNVYGSVQPSVSFGTTGTTSVLTSPTPSSSFPLQYYEGPSITSTNYNGATIATGTGGGGGSMAYSGAIFVMMGNLSAEYATSPTGVTWTARGAFPGGFPGTSSNNCLSYVNGNFVAAGTNELSHGTTGTAWTTVIPASFGQGTSKCAFGGGVYVVATIVGATGAIWYSTTLATWTRATIPTTNQINAVVYTGSKFVYGTNSGQTVSATTPSGTWTSVPTVVNGITGINQLAVLGVNTYIGTTNSNVYKVANTTW